MDDAPRDRTDHAQIFNDALALLAPYPSLLLAVSGGPDSVALMLACARWPERASHDIAVATVDHGLRAESRAEAEEVARWARALGFTHHLLTWEGDKPATRIQERAREARYALLSTCATNIGASALVTAHHADDQAETILFRLTRGSGIAGLAGMSSIARYGDVALLRPFLSLRKRDLEAICASSGQSCFHDPSNASDRFARVKLRALAPLLEAQGLDHVALLRLGARAARADAALTHYAQETFARALSAAADGVAIDAVILRDAPQEILQRVIALAILRLRPDAPLRLERLENLARRLAMALHDGQPVRLTLADVSIEAGSGKLFFSLAPPRRAPH